MELNQAEFDEKVLKAKKPVVVEIWGLRCSFCEKLDPIFKEAASEMGETASFYQLLANDNIELSRKLKVMGVPMMLFYIHGVLIAKMKGLKSKKQILSQLEKMKNYTPKEAEKNKYKTILKRLLGK